MTVTTSYTIHNNANEDIKGVCAWDIFTFGKIEGPVVINIKAGESQEFLGEDPDITGIYRRLKAKCAFLGLEYGKNGVYILIASVPPSEEEE